jgi:hypothetical protein
MNKIERIFVADLAEGLVFRMNNYSEEGRSTLAWEMA